MGRRPAGRLLVSVLGMPGGDDLRSLMRLFPGGVCVVGANADGDRIAATMGSLVSLSLNPPLVGISVGRDLALHELLRSAGAFGVSILRGDQAQTASQFARGAPPIALNCDAVWAWSPRRIDTPNAPALRRSSWSARSRPTEIPTSGGLREIGRAHV